MKRVLIVIDHYETDMFAFQNKQLQRNFSHSVIGRILRDKIINHPQTGINTKNCILDIKFFYTKEVPHKDKRTNTYRKPPAKVLHQYAKNMVSYIEKSKPDLVISYGSWFADELVKWKKLHDGLLTDEEFRIINQL